MSNGAGVMLACVGLLLIILLALILFDKATTVERRLKVAWRRLRGRHDDGTEHEWVQIRLGPHACGFDYCHCLRLECTVCEEMKLINDGVDEVR